MHVLRLCRNLQKIVPCSLSLERIDLHVTSPQDLKRTTKISKSAAYTEIRYTYQPLEEGSSTSSIGGNLA